MVPQPTDGFPGCTYYLTLLRGDLQIRMGECVYLLHDTEPQGTHTDQVQQMARKLVEDNPEKLDIYRVERLWKNDSYVYYCKFIHRAKALSEILYVRRFTLNEIIYIQCSLPNEHTLSLMREGYYSTAFK